MNPSRREFLRYSAVVTGSAFLSHSFLFAQTETDQDILKQKFDLAISESLRDKPMSEIMGAVGNSFLGVPYKPHTLEGAGPERLVVNLKEFDCVTFVENTLAISRCIAMGKMTFNDFKQQLQLIRYRGGVINAYPSRLHYFTDWIDDNEKKGIVRNIGAELHGDEFKKKFSFMSSHRDAYKQLKNDRFFREIKTSEAALNSRKHFYLPKEKIPDARELIRDGDIIGITTIIEGLDITHTGMAFHLQGYLRFLHAPLSVGTVQITKRTIIDYLAIQEKSTGIMLARPDDPRT